MRLKITLASVAVAMLGATALQAQTTIIQDSFDSASARNSGTINSTRAAWYMLNNSSTPASIGLAASGGSGGSDLVFSATGNTTSSTYFTAQFAPTSAPIALGSTVGDYVKVSLTFKFTGLTTAGLGTRFGVFDSNGTNITADQTSTSVVGVIENDAGYGVTGGGSMTFDTDTAAATMFSGPGERSPVPSASANYFNAASDYVLDTTQGFTNAISASGAGALTANGTPYTMSMIFTRTAAGMDIMGELSGGLYGTITSQIAHDTTPSTTEFATLAFRFNNTATARFTSLTVTDLTVLSSIPEPATYAACMGALVLGVVLIRRRKAAK